MRLDPELSTGCEWGGNAVWSRFACVDNEWLILDWACNGTEVWSEMASEEVVPRHVTQIWFRGVTLKDVLKWPGRVRCVGVHRCNVSCERILAKDSALGRRIFTHCLLAMLAQPATGRCVQDGGRLITSKIISPHS